MVGIIKNATNGVFRAVGAVLDAPSELLRFGARKTWSKIPYASSRPVENFLETSFLTRSVAKVGTALGGAYAFSTLAGLPLLSAPVAAAAAIGLRATRLNQYTGKNLPADPKTPLLEAAQKIASFKIRQSSIDPRHPVPEATQAPPMAPLSHSSRNSRDETDRELQTLIQNASISSTILFIHANRLDLPIDSAAITNIIQDTLTPGGTLWSAYMKHLGKDLGWFQWIRACIWYFFSYTLGIVPNSIHLFMTNVLKEVRTNLDDRNRIHYLETGINRLLQHIDLFLEAYNNATKAYAEAKEPRGDIHFYRNEAIQKLGGGSLEELCKQFSTTLVDEFFPRIPFFETLKQNAFFGWFFEILDFLIGGLINCVGRWIVKWNLPSAVQSLIETGIDATSPTNLPFTIAITEAVTELLRDLHDTPTMDVSPPPFEPKKLPEAIDKLLKALDLTGSKDDPLDTQKKMRNRLRKHESGSVYYLGLDKFGNRLLSRQLREALTEGGHALIGYISDNTEKIMANILKLSNYAFDQGANVTPEQYKRAYQTLEEQADRTFKKVINTALKGVPHSQNKTTFEQLFGLQQSAVTGFTDEWNECATAIANAYQQNNQPALLAQLNRYIEALHVFIDSCPAAQADTSTPEVKNAFYETYYPFFAEIPKLADQILQTQERQGQCDRYARIIAQLQRLANSLGNDANPDLAAIQSNIPVDIDATNELQAKLRALRAAQEALSSARQNSVLNVGTHQQAVRAAIASFQTLVRRELQTYQQNQRQSHAQFQQAIQGLQSETQRIRQLAEAIQPARVEGDFIGLRALKSVAAWRATPLVIDVFKRAHQFITNQDIYDASTRILMRSVVDAYKR